MIYTKISTLDCDAGYAEKVLGISKLLEYCQKNLDNLQFPNMTEAIMGVGFFTDTLFVAPTLNNEDEHVLGIYAWDGEEMMYTGMYLYEVPNEIDGDSVLWVCFENLS